MDKLKTVDWRGLARSASNRVKQYALNLSDLELKVEEATNKDSWGPHGSVMAGMLPLPPLPAAGSRRLSARFPCGFQESPRLATTSRATSRSWASWPGGCRRR